MFTKLRNRFLVFNMLTTSVMMIIALSIIYVSTYYSVSHAVISYAMPSAKGGTVATKPYFSSNVLNDHILTTFLFVGSIMLVVIFMVSLYFANRAIKPIIETWEQQKQFVADASHELKTPLSIITANYDALLANKEETIDSQIKWLGYIKTGTDRMTKLISDLLSLARMDDVNLDIVKTVFNLSNEVHNMVSSMVAVAIEKDIALSQSIEPSVMVEGDPDRIKEVIAILFDNAVKYTPTNGNINMALTKSKRQATFSIQNTGGGISEQDIPHVFDRFYRADSSRTHDNGGFGLGLSIAKSFVIASGGNIYVSSVENGWTTFTFTLRCPATFH
jgi:two-component system, OmpR family, sensor histidine kinase CiaH